MNPPPDHPFDAPWQAQAFAMTVALHRAGLFTWSEWTRALGAELAGGAAYWDAWLAALEGLAADRTGVAPAALHALADRWQAAALATPHGQVVTLDAQP